ncbi:MAG TPA: MarR family transcriptional regulator [Burkholderiales bacterium]|nr:MarR family transcriptional regulator [Burkholderiales bacterium]
MIRDLSRFERGIGQLAKLHPDMPRDAVMLIRLTYHAFLSLDARLEAHFERHRLTTSSWLALMMIYCSPRRRVTPSELSAAVIQSRTHMTRVADDLAEKGLIRRMPSAEDRRRVDLALTATGVRTIERLLPLTWNEYERALGAFTIAERRQLEGLLRRWLQHLGAAPSRASVAPQAKAGGVRGRAQRPVPRPDLDRTRKQIP